MMTPAEANRITVERFRAEIEKRRVELGISLENETDLKMMRNRRHQRDYRIRKQNEQQH